VVRGHPDRTLEENLMLGPETTLGEAWGQIEDRCNEGLPCPLCGQRVQVYWRNINSEMAWVAIRLYRYGLENGEDFAYMPDISAGKKHFGWGDYAKLRHWGVLEEQSGTREDGSNRVGYWRITDLGRQWVTGIVSLPRYVRVYNNQALGPPTPYSKSGELRPEVSIRDALNTKFDYDALMRGET
jgi:hypothetical protein